MSRLDVVVGVDQLDNTAKTQAVDVVRVGLDETAVLKRTPVPGSLEAVPQLDACTRRDLVIVQVADAVEGVDLVGDDLAISIQLGQVGGLRVHQGLGPYTGRRGLLGITEPVVVLTDAGVPVVELLDLVGDLAVLNLERLVGHVVAHGHPEDIGHFALIRSLRDQPGNGRTVSALGDRRHVAVEPRRCRVGVGLLNVPQRVGQVLEGLLRGEVVPRHLIGVLCGQSSGKSLGLLGDSLGDGARDLGCLERTDRLATDDQRIRIPGQGEVGGSGNPLGSAVGKVLLDVGLCTERVLGGLLGLEGSSLYLLLLLQHFGLGQARGFPLLLGHAEHPESLAGADVVGQLPLISETESRVVDVVLALESPSSLLQLQLGKRHGRRDGVAVHLVHLRPDPLDRLEDRAVEEAALLGLALLPQGSELGLSDARRRVAHVDALLPHVLEHLVTDRLGKTVRGDELIHKTVLDGLQIVGRNVACHQAPCPTTPDGSS